MSTPWEPIWKHTNTTCPVIGANNIFARYSFNYSKATQMVLGDEGGKDFRLGPFTVEHCKPP